MCGKCKHGADSDVVRPFQTSCNVCWNRAMCLDVGLGFMLVTYLGCSCHRRQPSRIRTNHIGRSASRKRMSQCRRPRLHNKEECRACVQARHKADLNTPTSTRLPN
eukprot:jgi/Chrzof1/7844/Cz02g38180.t1